MLREADDLPAVTQHLLRSPDGWADHLCSPGLSLCLGYSLFLILPGLRIGVLLTLWRSEGRCQACVVCVAQMLDIGALSDCSWG